MLKNNQNEEKNNDRECTLLYAAAFSRKLRKLPASAPRRWRPCRRGATVEVCSKRQSKLLKHYNS